MKFSLIVATFGRSLELRRLLDSIVLQAYPDLELIIVDQNADDRVLRVIESYRELLEIRHLVSRPGATRARNVGLAVASGDVFGFPDDDCWYPENLLHRVAGFLRDNRDWDGVIGHTVNASGQTTLPWHDVAGKLSPAMSWRRAVTYVYFLKRPAAIATDGFDESLGPGAGTPWGAGDDNDYMLRALKRGARVYFDPGLAVHHPPLFPGFDPPSIGKRASYARADGRVLRKHPMPFWWVLAFYAVPLARLIILLPTFDRARLRFHWVTLAGRIKGFLDRPDS